MDLYALLVKPFDGTVTDPPLCIGTWSQCIKVMESDPAGIASDGWSLTHCYEIAPWEPKPWEKGENF